MELTFCSKFLLLLVLACTTTAAGTRSIFILAGQSNMVGAGGLTTLGNVSIWDGVTPPECQPSPLILRLAKNLSWEEALEPLHQLDSSGSGFFGVGPGMPFAHSVLKRRPSIGEVGLVPCAVAATNISLWMRGTKLYNRMLTRAQAALSDGGQIRSLLWYQGEADSAALRGTAEAYKGRLVQFFTDLRSDLQLPLLPVIQVALASGGPHIDIIRRAQLETGLQNVYCVDAMGLELKSDGVHLTTGAQVQLGAMLADSFLHNIGGLAM